MDSTMVEVAPGVRLHVRRWLAEGGGRPFLLVHGLSSNARLWDAVASKLSAAGHAVFAVDLRSHGESDAPPTGHDTATAATDLAALIGSADGAALIGSAEGAALLTGVSGGLGLAPAIVAGQSWGGNVVVRLAARHPSMVAALALVDGGWIDLSTQFPTWEACEAALRPPDVDGLTPDDVRGFLRRDHPDWSDDAVDATLANLRVRADGTLERRLPVSDHMTIVRSMWDDPPWRDYPNIAVPVLLLPAVPVDADGAARRRGVVEKAAAALPRATIREYVGADHDLHAQHPDELAADLLALARER